MHYFTISTRPRSTRPCFGVESLERIGNRSDLRRSESSSSRKVGGWSKFCLLLWVGARGEGWSLSFLFELMRVDEDCRKGGREGRSVHP